MSGLFIFLVIRYSLICDSKTVSPKYANTNGDIVINSVLFIIILSSTLFLV